MKEVPEKSFWNHQRQPHSIPCTRGEDVITLDLPEACPGVSAGCRAPLAREMEYSQILCVEEATCFLELIHWESKRLWFPVYDYEVVARTNPDAVFLGWANALNGDGYVKWKSWAMKVWDPNHGLLWSELSIERLGSSSLWTSVVHAGIWASHVLTIF